MWHLCSGWLTKRARGETSPDPHTRWLLTLTRILKSDVQTKPVKPVKPVKEEPLKKRNEKSRSKIFNLKEKWINDEKLNHFWTEKQKLVHLLLLRLEFYIYSVLPVSTSWLFRLFLTRVSVHVGQETSLKKIPHRSYTVLVSDDVTRPRHGFVIMREHSTDIPDLISNLPAHVSLRVIALPPPCFSTSHLIHRALIWSSSSSHIMILLCVLL